jgi:hypothetical protein
MAGRKRAPTRVYLEVAKGRTFAMALDWPGWGRSGKNPEAALAALADYATRYAPVAARAGEDLPAGAADRLTVVEELPGSATTTFGAPGAVASSDAEPTGAKQAQRMAALVRACWDTFDAVAAASPAQLRKGPRGGGRDRDKMIDHVLGAESGYARKIGVKHKQPALGDLDAIDALRADIIAVLGARSDGAPPVPNGWPVRYAARRIAWHVLDHAWEMEDRRDPQG